MASNTRERESSWESPELCGARARLRPATQRDEAAYVALRLASREFLAPWEADASDHDPFGPERFRRFIACRADRRRWLIERRDDGRLAGALSLTRVDLSTRSASLGFWVGAEHARRGLMAEALGLVLAWSESSLGLAQVRASVLPENSASRALLAKLGFELESEPSETRSVAGRQREHELWTRALAPGYLPQSRK